MKRLLIVLIFFMNCVLAFSQEHKAGIHFEELSLEQAQAKAKSLNKPLFLHGFASWCHLCDFMRDSVYTNPKVAEYYNKTFVCVKLDMENEGKEVNRKLLISKFPCLVYFDPNGNPMHRATGKKSVDEFIQLGKDALDSTKQFYSWDKKYKAGKLKASEVPVYFKMYSSTGLDNQIELSNYLSKVPDSLFTSYDNWRIIYDLYRDVETPITQRILNYKSDFERIYTTDSINNRLLVNYNGTLMIYVQKLDSSGYIGLVQKIKASKLDIGPKIIAYAELNRAKMRSEWKNYEALSAPFIENYCKDDQRRLGEVAFTISERSTDKVLLLKAESWARNAVSLSDIYRNNHTLAILYYKNGKKELARSTAQHAIELGKKANVDYNISVLLMDKIEEMP
jgi:thioredoxin-related protein